MSLSNLLEEMTVFAKAQPLSDDPDGDQDDEDIQAAAAAANADNASQEAGAADGGAEDEGGDDKGLVKSFSFELEGGERVEAYDATELIKSLGASVEALRGESLGVMQQAFTLIKSQAAELANLKKQVHELGSAGRGRKTVVTVAAKVAAPETFAKSADAEGGLSKAEFFAKAATAQSAGRITAADISVAEAYLNKGMPIPERIVSRVIAG